MKKYYSFFISASLFFNFSPLLRGESSINSGGMDAATVNSWLKIAQLFMDGKNADSCIAYALRADSLAAGIRYKHGEADAELMMGYACLNLKGEYFNARQHFLRVEAICGEISYPMALFKSLTAIGNICENGGDEATNAVLWYLKSLKTAEQMGEKKAIATAHHNIGVGYEWRRRTKEDNEFALLEYSEATKIFEEIKDTAGIISCYYSLGIHHANSGNAALAIKYLLSAVPLAAAIRDTLLLAKCYHEIAQDQISNAPEALKYFFKELEVLNQTNYLDTRTKNYLGIACVFQRTRQYDSIFLYTQKALEICKQTNSLSNFETTYGLLAVVYEQKNDFKNAYYYSQLHLQANESLYQKQRETQVSEAAAKYESEKKEQQLRLLRVEDEKKEVLARQEIQRQKFIRNTVAYGASALALSSGLIFFLYKSRRDAEQRQKEAEFKQSVSDVEMKALRAQMNPHFIFNALQSIQTFLLKRNPEEASVYLLKFSKLMRLVLENSQYPEVPLNEDLQALELYMQLESQRLMDPFTYQIKVDDDIDAEAVKIPPLILQPFIENAIWHGLQYKEEAGYIHIHIRKQNDMLLCMVEDNGVGRVMSKALRTPVFMKRESLGMKLTEERLRIVSQLKKIRAYFNVADLWTTDNKPGGTRVELFLPLETV